MTLVHCTSMSKTPVKYFVALLMADASLLPNVIGRLQKRLGETDFAGEWLPFIHTNFYAAEMGTDLKRCIISFKELLPSQILPKAKKWTAKIEDKFRVGGKRRVNIDAGYMDFCKVVLASGKFGGHKIALTEDCYADMIMRYEKGVWLPFPWCFPDFASGIYDQSFTKIRNLLKTKQN